MKKLVNQSPSKFNTAKLAESKIFMEFSKFLMEKNKKADFMCKDKWLKAYFPKIKKLAFSDEPVLLIGETGSGKEIISRFIHFLSKRKNKPFYPINCAVLTDEILQSELFGHEKGAFTSAVRKAPGKLKMADGGTVFLDEIQASTFRFQNSLLRFIETGDIHAVGAERIDRADVRIISACSLSPEKLLSEGKLLLSFYHRISHLRLFIPPIRERKDIENYIYYFLLKECENKGIEHKEISPSAMAYLKSYSWPGNLRELKAIIHSLILFSDGKIIGIDHIPEEIMKARRISFSDILSREVSERKSLPEKSLDFRRPDIKKVLKEYRWSTFPSDAIKKNDNIQLRKLWLEKLILKMVEGGKTFWDMVYGPYMNRELNRSQLKEILCFGLELSGRSFKGLLPIFHIEDKDYKKFLDFLRKQGIKLRDLKD